MLFTRTRSRLRSGSEDGAAAVEFALVVPLLLTLLFGIIEFGSYFNAQIVASNAAREAVREIAVVEDIRVSDALEGAATSLRSAGLTVTASTATDLDDVALVTCASGTTAVVSLSATTPLSTGLFGDIAVHVSAARLCGG